MKMMLQCSILHTSTYFTIVIYYVQFHLTCLCFSLYIKSIIELPKGSTSSNPIVRENKVIKCQKILLKISLDFVTDKQTSLKQSNW